MKKKLSRIIILGLYLILSTAPLYSSTDAVKVAHTIGEEVRTAAKSIQFLTVNQILKDPETFKKAWEALLEGLSDAKKAMNIYDKIPTPSQEAKTIVDDAHIKIKNLQSTIAAFLKNIYDSVKKATTPLDSKRTLVSAYDQLTEDWSKNPLGTKNVDYQKLIKELVGIVKSASLQEAPATVIKSDEKLEEKTVAEAPTIVHSLDDPEIIAKRMHIREKTSQNLANQLTVNAILTDEESAKSLWIRLMSALKDAKKEQTNYTKITETAHSKIIVDESIAMHANIIHTIENLFKDIEKQTVLNTGARQHALLSVYETWTTQWIENGYGQADFKEKTEKFMKQFHTESEPPQMPPLSHEESASELPPPY